MEVKKSPAQQLKITKDNCQAERRKLSLMRNEDEKYQLITQKRRPDLLRTKRKSEMQRRVPDAVS